MCAALRRASPMNQAACAILSTESFWLKTFPQILYTRTYKQKGTVCWNIPIGFLCKCHHNLLRLEQWPCDQLVRMGSRFSRFSVRDPFHIYHVRSEVTIWTWLHSMSRFCREVNDRTSLSFLLRKQCRKHSDRRLSMSARLVIHHPPPTMRFQ